MDSFTLNITGRPASKKNSRKAIRVGGRIIMIAGPAYDAFRTAALWQLKRAPKTTGIVDVSYTFYQKGKLTQDADNAIASINDVLEDAGIIENDRYIRSGKFMVLGGEKDWKTVITITPLC